MTDDPKPLPPEILADALQDKIHEDKGKVRTAESHKFVPTSKDMRCYYHRATPEKRCTRPAKWKGRNADAVTNEWLWCDEHAPKPYFREALPMETTPTELKPCPFCGRSLEYDNDLGISYHPKPPNGYCPAEEFWIRRHDMAGMKEIWNTRPESEEVTRLRARVAELEEAFLTLRDTWQTSHYGHFDRQGTAGANCPACILDRWASDLIYKMTASLERSG